MDGISALRYSGDYPLRFGVNILYIITLPQEDGWEEVISIVFTLTEANSAPPRGIGSRHIRIICDREDGLGSSWLKISILRLQITPEVPALVPARIDRVFRRRLTSTMMMASETPPPEGRRRMRDEDELLQVHLGELPNVSIAAYSTASSPAYGNQPWSEIVRGGSSPSRQARACAIMWQAREPIIAGQL